MLIKSLLATIGFIAIVLGVIGIFLPMLPTTPFLLLAAWCFARSSKRFHYWLINHPTLGKFIYNWNNKNLSHQQRNRIISLMWLSMTISMLIIYWLSPLSMPIKSYLIMLLIIIGLAVSWHINKHAVRD